VKLRTIVFILVSIITSDSCKDVIFNNPLDPNASIETLKIVKIVSTNLSGEGDIAYDGEKFWKSNIYGTLHAFDIESGVTIRTLSSKPASGLAFFQDRFYICNGENIIYSYDPLSGDLIDQISTAELYPKYLSSGEAGLLLYDVRSNSFFDYNPETGVSTQLFQVTGMNISGIEFYQGGVLFIDTNSNSIYHYSHEGNLINVFLSPANATSGITVDGADYIFLLTLDGQLYKVSLP